ncbi:MAG: ABC transporter substrate-binding protein [Gammaproteobacteria bacterium]|nr:ABC transporter substrate-binding protein [Gammaproteobacteria bacterium]
MQLQLSQNARSIKEPPMSRWVVDYLSILLLMVMFGLFSSSTRAAVEPQELVRLTSEQVLQTLEKDSAIIQDAQRLYALVDGVLIQHMDFERMSRWVLGKYWKTASAEQQAQFIAEFRRLLVRTYATALATYSGQQISYLPSRGHEQGSEVTVRTEIAQPTGQPVQVNYSLYSRNGEWKAYDVQIGGISLIANYRATFAAEVRGSGLDALIQSLATRNQQAMNNL